MNAFEKHGIKSLSPTGLLTYQANPSMWCGKYLLGWKDDAGPKAWIGNAVEAGLHSWLNNADDFKQRALDTFILKAQGEISDEITEAMGRIPLILDQAILSYQPRKDAGVLPLYQVKCLWWIDGIEVPCIGYLDFEWEDQIDDLKTTMAAPSSPRPDHVAQIGMYMKARNKDAGLLTYCTPKKFVQHKITTEMADEALKALVRSARAIRSLLTTVRDGRQAMSIFAPDFSDYRWNDATKQLATRALG